MDKLRISQKLLLVFGGMFALMLTLGLMSLGSMAIIKSKITTVQEIRIPNIIYALDISVDLAKLRVLGLTHVGQTAQQDILATEAEMAQVRSDMAATMDKLDKNIRHSTVRAEFDALRTDIADYTNKEAAFLDLSRSGDKAGAQAASLSAAPVFKSAVAHAIKAELAIQARSANDVVEIGGTYWTSFALLVAGILAGAAGVYAGLRVLNKQISQPLTEVAETTMRLASGAIVDVPHQERVDEVGSIAKALETFRGMAAERSEIEARNAAEQALVSDTLARTLETLAAGDLTDKITAAFPPSYEAVSANFNLAVGNLRSMIQSVVEGATDIRSGVVEIALASEDLARRTESNAASLEQTSAALVQIDTRIKQSAESSTATVLRADQTMATVRSGRATADDAMQAMNRVSGSAKGIDTVIEGLDKIAFQTRVLAMNAAVEAGRAGDAGRGFAVVADLVSALAMRAEEEAKRARDQLTVTQTEIKTAVDAVRNVDGALAAITGDVEEVNKLLGGIAADNQAQALTMTEITGAIGSMDRTTQQNAAMVEETSAAARNLTSEVEALVGNAAKFKFERRVRNVPVAVERRVARRLPAANTHNFSAPPPSAAAPLPAARSVTAAIRHPATPAPKALPKANGAATVAAVRNGAADHDEWQAF